MRRDVEKVMSLDKHVHVVSRFQRSVRIDADLEDPSALDGFLCTESFQRALTTLAQNLRETGHGAYTWTGPYGGGKSVLLLALASSIGPRGRARTTAENAIGDETKEAISAAFRPGGAGWITLAIVGARAPAHALVWDALLTARLVQKNVGKPPAPREVIRTLVRISDQTHHSGVLVAVDELGRVLEQAANNNGDVHFLQDLAEVASRSKRRLCVVGVLHQAFEEYASRLHKEARDDWAKVQGRFIDIPLSPTGGEQLELLARAISSKGGPKSHDQTAMEIAGYIKRYRTDAPPDTAAVLKRCWPLHPITACLLGPISRRRFGQNQRSLFAFLNSREPRGFQEFIRTASIHDVYYPEQLFDYLQLNFEHAILASPDGHRWSLAIDAIERAEKKGATAAAVGLLKSIGLLDLFRERSGLFASKEVLRTLSLNQPAREFERSLEQLRQWSVLAFREHLSAYAIFAGSDFDLQAALEDAKQAVKEPDLKLLRHLANLRPIVAKRHYHDTGAFRWLEVDVVTTAELSDRLRGFEPRGNFGHIFLLIAGPRDSDKGLRDFAQSTTIAAKYPCLIGVCPAASRVTELTAELLELEHIRVNHAQLRDDIVARREVDARTATVAQQLEGEIRNAFVTARFYHKGERLNVHGLGDLSRYASDAADQLYSSGPLIVNELLNRGAPSSNAVAAQKALLRAMVLSPSASHLGLKGFPPERGLYDSILDRTGLHRTRDGVQSFYEPTKKDDARLRPLWRATDEFLTQAATKPIRAADVYKLFADPPFGIRNGLRPILFLAYVQSRMDRFTVYVDGVLEAQLTDFAIDRLIMDPATLSLRIFDPTERQRQLLDGVRDALRTIGVDQSLDLTDTTGLARALVSMVRTQPPYVLRTMRLSPRALALRATLRAASDPHVLLHETLPFTLQQLAGKPHPKLPELISILDSGVKEIASAYQAMLQTVDHIVRSELEISRDPTGDEELHERADLVRGLTGDLRLEAFIGRMATYTSDSIEGVASLAVNKSPRDWTENDFDAALLELSKLAEKFKRAEAFARVKGKPNGRHAISFVIGLDRAPRVVATDFEIPERDRKKVLEIARQISALGLGHKPEVLLAALAQAGSELICAADSPQSKLSTTRMGHI